MKALFFELLVFKPTMFTQAKKKPRDLKNFRGVLELKVKVLATALFSIFCASAVSAAPSSKISCNYGGVSYKSVANPAFSDNYMAVSYVAAKCAQYPDLGFLSPYIIPDELTFKVTDSDQIVIKNKGYTFDTLLIGDQFPKGKDANKYLNDAINAAFPNQKFSKLIGFTISKREIVYKDAGQNTAYPNPFESELASIQAFEEQERIQQLSEKYGVNISSGMTLSELNSLDSFLKGNGDYGLSLYKDELSIFFTESSVGGVKSFMRGSVVPALLKGWNITEEAAKRTLTVRIKNGKNIRVFSEGIVNTMGAIACYNERAQLSPQDHANFDKLKAQYNIKSPYVCLNDLQVHSMLAKSEGTYYIKLEDDALFGGERLVIGSKGYESGTGGASYLHYGIIPATLDLVGVTHDQAKAGILVDLSKRLGK